jgi:hypothetical protein
VVCSRLVRYKLSHYLPKVIPELPNSKVHPTSQSRNYVYVVPIEIGGNPSEIYFMLRRVPIEAMGWIYENAQTRFASLSWHTRC